MCGDRIIPVQHNQYNECWRPSSWRHQGIGAHDFDYVEPINSCLTRGRVPTTCIISVWGDDVNVRYIFYVSHEKCSTWRVNDFIPSMYIYIYIHIYIYLYVLIYIHLYTWSISPGDLCGDYYPGTLLFLSSHYNMFRIRYPFLLRLTDLCCRGLTRWEGAILVAQVMTTTWYAPLQVSCLECTHHLPQKDLMGVSVKWCSDAIWRHRFGSVMIQIVACCPMAPNVDLSSMRYCAAILMAPSHYQNQCWPLISKACWQIPEDNFREIVLDILEYNILEHTATSTWVEHRVLFHKDFIC